MAPMGRVLTTTVDLALSGQGPNAEGRARERRLALGVRSRAAVAEVKVARAWRRDTRAAEAQPARVSSQVNAPETRFPSAVCVT